MKLLVTQPQNYELDLVSIYVPSWKKVFFRKSKINVPLLFVLFQIEWQSSNGDKTISIMLGIVFKIVLKEFLKALGGI